MATFASPTAVRPSLSTLRADSACTRSRPAAFAAPSQQPSRQPDTNVVHTGSLLLTGGAAAAALCGRNAFRKSKRLRGRTMKAAVAELPRLGEDAKIKEGLKPEPLQIVKINLEKNSVEVGEKEMKRLEEELKKTGVEKVAVVAVMGAFRTGKSFMLDLMLRYLREQQRRRSVASGEVAEEECEIPDWVLDKNVPSWAVRCGQSMVEGREGREEGDLSGFLWRPGMDKCTEGIWVWSEVFVCKAGDEDVAVLLIDTQGAWDAKMTKEQSATVFGLTTLLASRLVYNVAKQIQQDKIENLLYFTDFAQAALRANKEKFVEGVKPFQTLEFLVRDWPHYPDNASVEEGRKMMLDHLAQYMDDQSEDIESVRTLKQMFQDMDVWCLPHPSLKIERASWDGDLAVIDPAFWTFIDAYLTKIFSPSALLAKQNLGTPITTTSFTAVIRNFIAAFASAAPQARTFAQAMETSTSMLAKDLALKALRRSLSSSAEAQALPDEVFEAAARKAAEEAQREFDSRAIFGTDAGIRKTNEELRKEIDEEITRFRDENDRKLEASLAGLTKVALAALFAFLLDRASDVTCDWWSGFCRDISTDLTYFYGAVAAYTAYSLYGINAKQGQLSAAAAALELGKMMIREVKGVLKGPPAKPQDP